jgi:hypothetical protein
MQSSKIYYFYFFGALGQAVHQAVSKKRPKSPKLDIAFKPLTAVYVLPAQYIHCSKWFKF